MSEDASWLLVRDEYLWHGPVVDTALAGGTEEGANAPKEAMFQMDMLLSTVKAPVAESPSPH